MRSSVVVGVDGSDASLTALDWAADEAARHRHPLRIVNASLWERYEGAAPPWAEKRPSGQVLAENILGMAMERVRVRAPGLRLSGEVLAEDPTSTLLREGQEALMVVVGSRGRGAVRDVLLGSVSLLVAARSSGPVVVVRGDEHGVHARHRRVLLGVGEQDVDSPAVRFAFHEASVRDADLDVVHTWREPAHEQTDHPLLAGAPHSFQEYRAAEFLEKALEPAQRAYPEVCCHRATVEGPAHRVLTERSAAADLLIVGARRGSHLIGLELGRVAHRALHHAACPVAVVPQHRSRTAADTVE